MIKMEKRIYMEKQARHYPLKNNNMAPEGDMYVFPNGEVVYRESKAVDFALLSSMAEAEELIGYVDSVPEAFQAQYIKDLGFEEGGKL